MKIRSMMFVLVALFATAVFSYAKGAANANMGTWKLNEAKSKLAADAPKNHTVVYSAAGDSIKVTVDGVDGAGKPAHNEWTGKFDGKDYPVTGDAASDSRAYTEVDSHTLSMTIKKVGKVIMTGTIKVSADGKTRTVTTSGTDAKGKKTSGTGVYDKK